MVATTAVDWKGADQNGLWLNFAVDAHNLGKTPATDVNISQPRVVISDDAANSSGSDLLKQACGSVMKGNRVQGSIIYPGIPVRPIEASAWVPGSQIRKESARHSGLTILVAVCVIYRPTYQVDRPYRYGQVYAVGDRSAYMSGIPPYLQINKPVPTENVMVEPYAFTRPIID